MTQGDPAALLLANPAGQAIFGATLTVLTILAGLTGIITFTGRVSCSQWP